MVEQTADDESDGSAGSALTGDPASSPGSSRWPIRRRRSAAAPFLLCITDHDTGRFTLEGPMIDAEAWIREVIGARRAERNISCRVFSYTDGQAAIAWGSATATRWPSGSIVSPETIRASSNGGSARDRLATSDEADRVAPPASDTAR